MNHSKSMLRTVLVAAAAGCLLTASLAMAGRNDKAPDSQAPIGHARVLRVIERGADNNITVPVTIDLRRVTLDGQSAVLGAYVLRVDFDATQVEYLSAIGGRDSHYAAAPVATAAARANSEGLVKLTASQTDNTAPSGLIHVASLRFAEKVAGGADSIRVRLESVASALSKDADGKFLTNLEIKIEGAEK